MILLDTHTWIWWVSESSQLSAKARRAIQETEDAGVSIISCWEVAMLVARGRIGFTLDVKVWIDRALQRPKIRLLPIDPEIAVLSTRLPGSFHADSVDRLLAATCMTHGVPLVGMDERIAAWGQIACVW